MGSGAVGVEFGSIFRRFGSEVTIIELLPRIVPVEDEAVSAELERSFKKQGIKVLTGTRVTKRKGRAPTASTSRRRRPTARRRSSTAEYLLVATGRGPVTSGLGAEEAGLRMERGYVHVGRRLSNERAGDFRDRRRHHVRRAWPSAACASVVRGRHRRRRADRGQGRTADQLRPGAGLHLLRSGDRKCRADREAKRSSVATTSKTGPSSSASSAARALPARSKGSSRSCSTRSTTRSSAST